MATICGAWENDPPKPPLSKGGLGGSSLLSEADTGAQVHTRFLTRHEQLEGRGYHPPFEGSKHLRDTTTGVRIEFLVAGQYPGDGKPKPVAFPDPASVSEELAGVKCLKLSTLVELKLTSGTAPGRLKDLADVQELIRVLGLTLEFADELHPSVRDQYRAFWHEMRSADQQANQ